LLKETFAKHPFSTDLKGLIKKSVKLMCIIKYIGQVYKVDFMGDKIGIQNTHFKKYC